MTTSFRRGRPVGRYARAGRLALAVLAIATLGAWPTTGPAQDVAGGRDATVVEVPVSGTVDLGLAPFIERSIREAEEAGAAAVVLDMNTPGGRIDAAHTIVGVIRDADVPVYTYVDNWALSAGALIALATDGIYMRPGSVIGAATPVTGGGQKASEKMVSAMRSEMRALAEARGLDPRVAEAMVDEDVEVPGVIERGKLLTLTTDQAVEIGYATEVESRDAMLAHIGLTGATAQRTEVNWAEKVVRFLSHPVVAPFLLSIGFLGLIIEIKTPTFGLAGAVGALSIAAFFGSHLLVGLAGWEEVMLLGAGVGLLIFEIFVVPGFGVFGIAGIVGILASIYLSLVGQFATGVDYTQAAGVLSLTLLLVVVATWALLRTLPSNRRLLRAGVMLGEAAGRDTGYISAARRPELVGATGRAATDLRPAGTGEFDDERLDVVADVGWVEAGTPIRIVRSEGYRLVVRPIEDAQAVGSAD